MSTQHLIDELQIALSKRGYTHVDIQWQDAPDFAIVQIGTPLPFPMYLQPDGCLSRVMVTVSIEDKPVLLTSTATLEKHGVDYVLQCINGAMCAFRHVEIPV